MKKAIVALAISFGGILFVAGLSVAELFLCLANPITGVFLSLILLIVSAVFLNRLRVKLNIEYSIPPAVFVCCSTLPALALDAILYFVFNQVGGTSDWDIICFLFILADAVTAPVLLVLLLDVMLISFLISKFRAKRSTRNEEEI